MSNRLQGEARRKITNLAYRACKAGPLTAQGLTTRKAEVDRIVRFFEEGLDILDEERGQHRAEAVRLILAERERQETREGFTSAHDDEHAVGELGRAAACYATSACAPRNMVYARPPAGWPWQETDWKPSTPIRDLVKAGALVLAELERVFRAPAVASSRQGDRGVESLQPENRRPRG